MRKIQTSKEEITIFRIFAKLVKAEVQKRDGYIKVPRSALAELIWCGWQYKQKEQTIVFTLKEPDKKRRDSNAFVDKLVYRLDIMMKYLIMTAPGQRLVFTNTDLEDNPIRLLIDQHLNGLFALTTDQEIPSLSDDRRTITVGHTITVTKGAKTPLRGRKN